VLVAAAALRRTRAPAAAADVPTARLLQTCAGGAAGARLAAPVFMYHFTHLYLRMYKRALLRAALRGIRVRNRCGIYTENCCYFLLAAHAPHAFARTATNTFRFHVYIPSHLGAPWRGLGGRARAR